MGFPCEDIKDLADVGGHLVENGKRNYAEWKTEMQKHVPAGFSDGVYQRVWGRIHADMAEAKPAYNRNFTSKVLIEQLKNRMGWSKASDFIDELDDSHEDIYKKVLDGKELTLTEKKSLAEVYNRYKPKRIKGKPQDPVSAITDAVATAKKEATARLNSARAPLTKGPRIDVTTMEGAVRKAVEGRIGMKGTDIFLDDLKKAGLYDKFLANNLSESERGTVASLFLPHQKKSLPSQTPKLPAIDELDTAMAKARKDAQAQMPKVDTKTPVSIEDQFQKEVRKRMGSKAGDMFLMDIKNHPEGRDIYNKLLRGEDLTDVEKYTLLGRYQSAKAIVKTPLIKPATPSQALQTLNEIIKAGQESSRKRQSADQSAQSMASTHLHSMEQFFPTSAKREDLASISLQEYRDGARNLAGFAKRMKASYGGSIDSDKMQTLFQEAAKEYQTRKKPVEDIKKEIYQTVRQELLDSRTPFQRGLHTVNDILSAPMSLTTSLDMSALRQGSKLAFSHPFVAVLNKQSPFVKMLQAASFKDGEAVANAVNADIKSRPLTREYERAKLHLSDHGDGKFDPQMGEEIFRSQLVKDVPWVKWSERVFVTFLNKLRADSFDLLYDQWFGKGPRPTDEEVQALGNLINVSTGRASSGRRVQGFSQAMNGIMFSPRNRISQFQWAAGQPLYGGSARTRIGVAKEYARYTASVATMLGLASAAQKLTGDDPDYGVTVYSDPHSKDFGNIRVGNVMLNPLEGAAKPFSVATRMWDARKLSQSGILRDEAPSDTLKDLARTTLSPSFGSLADFISRGEQNQSLNPKKASPRYTSGEFKAPYGKDFLDRDVTDVAGGGTDIASAGMKIAGKSDTEIDKVRFDSKAAWLRAMDYYLSRTAIPITATGAFNAFAENGIDPLKIPLTTLAVTADWFGINSRVMDKQEMARRGYVKKSLSQMASPPLPGQ